MRAPPPNRSLNMIMMYVFLCFSERQDTHTHNRFNRKRSSYSEEVEEEDSLLEELEPPTGSPSTKSAPPHFVIARKLWHRMQKDTADLQGVHLE